METVTRSMAQRTETCENMAWQAFSKAGSSCCWKLERKESWMGFAMADLSWEDSAFSRELCST